MYRENVRVNNENKSKMIALEVKIIFFAIWNLGSFKKKLAPATSKMVHSAIYLSSKIWHNGVFISIFVYLGLS